MRKSISREERARKEKRNKIIVGLLLVGLMVLSTVGYTFYQTGQKKGVKYKGVKFVLMEDGLWHFNLGKEFATTYTPKETENIFTTLSLSLQDYANKPLYFSHDSEQEGIEEVVRNIGQFVSRIQRVCLDECEEDLPVKTCSDNIIIIRYVNETLIKQEGNCVYVLAKDDIIKASDAFIFRLLGI